MLSLNPMMMARFLTGKGLVVHEGHAQGRPLSETESNSLAKEELLGNPHNVSLKRYSNTLQHCFETFQQMWTDVPQAGSKATPDTRDEVEESVVFW